MEPFDPLVLLILGKNVLNALNTDQDQRLLLEDLLDAAASGDAGGIQRQGGRLEEQLFLFDEVSDHEIAARRFFVAIAQVLAAQQQASGIIKAFPYTWRDGVLVRTDELRLLKECRLGADELLLAKEMEDLTIYGWIATQDSSTTVEILNGDDKAWKSPATGGGRLSVLHAGLLLNQDRGALEQLIEQWAKPHKTPRQQRDQARIFTEIGKLKIPNPELQERLLSKWIDLYAPELNGQEIERTRAGEELMKHPPQWTRSEGAARSSLKLYEKIFDMAWPGSQPGLAPINILQMVALGLRGIRDHGMAGGAPAIRQIGKRLVEETRVSEADEVALHILIETARNTYKSKGQDAPSSLELTAGEPEEPTKRRRWALEWVSAGEALAKGQAGNTRAAKRKL